MGKSTVRSSATRGTSWVELRAFALSLPGVEEGICFGTSAVYVRKKLLARLRADGETVAIKTDFLDRDVLLEADPEAFYLTDHYRPYPYVLMKLGRVRKGVAQELLELAWRRAAPKHLLSQRPAHRGEAGRRFQPPSWPQMIRGGIDGYRRRHGDVRRVFRRAHAVGSEWRASG